MKFGDVYTLPILYNISKIQDDINDFVHGIISPQILHRYCGVYKNKTPSHEYISIFSISDQIEACLDLKSFAICICMWLHSIIFHTEIPVIIKQPY